MTSEIEQMILDNLEYRDGNLYWRKSYGPIKGGWKAGCVTKTGYRQVKINKKPIHAHRIVFWLHHGYWPKDKDIDHINRVKNDNRIENLRECTKSQNQWNICDTKNESKYGKGVSWDKSTKRYVARIEVNRKRIYLGWFNDPEEARKVAIEARKRYHGEWSYEQD